MKNNDKISKYRKKLLATTDSNKRMIYENKIQYYNTFRKNIDEAGLQKPQKFQSESYELNINDPISIKAIGYGTNNKEIPLELMEFERRVPRDNDVVIQILYCGVCHSDWHVILNEWKNSKYPVLVGHEITGKVIKVGKNVTKFKVGDSVAVGPNYNSCRRCNQCEIGFEQYCINDVTETYNMPDRKDDKELKPTGPITYGGYSNVIVANENYVLKIPDSSPLDKIAPVLCAGATMFTPLKYLQVNQNFKIGIAGIGGLGHIGIKLAKALGAHVVAITHTKEKLSEAKDVLGANESLLIDDKDKLKPHKNTFDLIIDTIPFNHDLMPYIELIKTNGTLWIVGSFFTMATDFDLVNRKGKIIRGSSTAGIYDTQEAINFCAENKIYPDIQLINIKDINKTHNDLVMSKVRYRYVIDVSTIYQ
jgi:alcohol dehydrogenase (NADP+)